MKPSTIAAIVIGLLCCLVAALYFIDPAGSLPSFLPGHAAGSTQHHMKHGILAFALAVICFVAAWFLSGPKQEAV